VPPQLSDALPVNGSAGGTNIAQVTVLFAGQVMVGGIKSLTVII
jgi:hypothetical protein